MRSAFSTLASVTSDAGATGRATSRIACAPASSAIRSRSACTAGALAASSGWKPSTLARHAIVLAVPITPQVPAVVASAPSTSAMRASETSPARKRAQ